MVWKSYLCLVSLVLAVGAGGCKPNSTGGGGAPDSAKGTPSAAASPSPAGKPSAANPEGVSEKLPGSGATAAAPGNGETQGESKANANAQVIVLGYHRLVNKVRRPDTEITATAFEAQMQMLKDAGVTVIPLRDLIAWREGKKEIPASSAVITFDDGWKSQYTVAWPIMQKFGYPFTLFIYTNYVKGQPRAGGESLSWGELSEMRDAGVDIQGHSVSHQDLRGKRQRPNDYEVWLKYELEDSKKLIEQQLGVKVDSLALPYGFYNAWVLQVAKDAGYKVVFTVNGQRITNGTPAALMGRFIIEGDKPRVFSEAVRSVAEASDGNGGVVRAVSPRALGTQPRDGAMVSDPRPVVKVNMEGLGASDAAKATMRISGLGLVNATYEPTTRTLTHKPDEDLVMGGHTVIVTAPSNRGGVLETRWSFIIVPPAPQKITTQTTPQAEAKR